MFVRIFDESAMAWKVGWNETGRTGKKRGTDGEKFETLIEILLIVCLEG